MTKYLPLQPPMLQNELQDARYRYHEFSPSLGLRHCVACYWTIDYLASDDSKLHRILPDGCTDIIFDLSSSAFSKGSVVSGLMTTFETMNLTGDLSLFGIRFFSHQARQFLRYPVSEFAGYHVYLEDLWGKEAERIKEEVCAAKGIPEVIERVENLLIKLLHKEKIQTDDMLQAGVQYIQASRGKLSIQALAENLNYSERNVRRIFQHELGVSPKQFIDILRFQYLLQELYGSKKTPAHFSETAVKYGYYDQPHFIRAFKRYYGLTPGAVQ